MARKTANRDEDIDPQAIARWNDEGGAPRPLNCGASRFRLHEAVELEIRPIWAHGTQAEQDPGRENRAADVSHDLWRFSCEFPDAPYLFNNLTPP
jgi:hypothetical protein